MTEVINLTFLCNLTEEKIRQLYNNNSNSDQAGDATWILTSAFIIFTMQSGFGLLEAGSVSAKNETNIMVKNAVDVIFGGLGYWICGFAFSFGDDPYYSNGFTGFGHFFTDTKTSEDSGVLFAKYFFQLSFATTATTIVSGAMAERTNLKAYMFFSFINFLSYVFPAHWIWADSGVFRKLGVVDVAGCGPVHVVGGTSAIVASIILKPRTGVFDEGRSDAPMASPTNVVLGTFMLWWGWLGFNCGSTFGVSGGKWKLASRAAVTTVNSSVGSGLWSIFYCYVLSKKYKGKLDIGIFTNCILGGLVSITAICAICKPWEALLIGMVGGFIVTYGMILVRRLKIDDPVSCIPVHFFCGFWGLLCVGLFGEKDELEGISKNYGIFKGGPFSYFGYQLLAAVTVMAWSATTTTIQLLIVDKLFGLRVSLEDELIGMDIVEHGIKTDHASHYETRSQFFGSKKFYRKHRNLEVEVGHRYAAPNETKNHQMRYQENNTNFGYHFHSSIGVDNFGFAFGNSMSQNTTTSLSAMSPRPSSSDSNDKINFTKAPANGKVETESKNNSIKKRKINNLQAPISFKSADKMATLETRSSLGDYYLKNVRDKPTIFRQNSV